ncbi:hypothetical protein ZOSMA_422G00010 [Zostera marina]|uniref:Uncharacterized protein n=1 Tax=Zostera marina TaxID=29655 RepID=A0A0K9P2G6_ZOSMR|nr:hypothetical protein ZOSMA_422G00010 [Zostera marina]
MGQLEMENEYVGNSPRLSSEVSSGSAVLVGNLVGLLLLLPLLVGFSYLGWEKYLWF